MQGDEESLDAHFFGAGGQFKPHAETLSPDSTPKTPGQAPTLLSRCHRRCGGFLLWCLGLVPTPGVEPRPPGGELEILAAVAWLSHWGSNLAESGLCPHTGDQNRSS